MLFLWIAFIYYHNLLRLSDNTSREPNLIIDITDCVEDKIKAVQKHRSQIRFSTRPYGFFVKIFARCTSLNTELKYAESFRVES